MKNAVRLTAIMICLSLPAYGQSFFNHPDKLPLNHHNLITKTLCFTQNRGQWNNNLLFRAELPGVTFYFAANEVACQFVRNTNRVEKPTEPELISWRGKNDHLNYEQETMLIKAIFVGAISNPDVIGEDPLPYYYNFFCGNEQSNWQIGVSNYASITYKNLWPGIDLKYHGDIKSMKYDFIVAPGADISQIRIRYKGVEKLAISNSGDLQIWTEFGSVSERIPQVYQEINGRKVLLSGRYILVGSKTFSFIIDNHNPEYPVCIDPELFYSTYI